MSEPRDDPRDMVAAAYERIAERYLRWSLSIDDDARRRMTSRFASLLLPGDRVLDLGCGAGIPTARELSGRFAVTGIDISARQVELARENVPDATFIQGDFSQADFAPASFHGVVALYSIVHLPRERHRDLFARIAGWLAPGGSLLATLSGEDSPDWRGEWLGEPMFFSGHDPQTSCRLLAAAGFDLLERRVRVIHEPEGDARFLWVLARRPGEGESVAGGRGERA
jgi:SAM-dependent methyltransferase